MMEHNIGLFLLGALGAILTIYMIRQQIIPEFRPLFDISKMDKEADEHRDHVKKTEKHIDDIQARLEGDSLSADVLKQLTTVLTTSQEELKDERVRLQTLEREIKQSQVISRSLGFFLYVILGGVFGSILAGRVEVKGLSGDLPPYFQSILIGATWTTYLSLIGFSSGREKADDRIEAAKKETSEMIDSFRKDIVSKIEKIVADAEEAEKVAHPVLAPDVKIMLDKEISKVNAGVEKNWDITRQMVYKDLM